LRQWCGQIGNRCRARWRRQIHCRPRGGFRHGVGRYRRRPISEHLRRDGSRYRRSENQGERQRQARTPTAPGSVSTLPYRGHSAMLFTENAANSSLQINGKAGGTGNDRRCYSPRCPDPVTFPPLKRGINHACCPFWRDQAAACSLAPTGDCPKCWII
jgi:hypothetical protein